MIPGPQIARTFQSNRSLINRHLEGLTHADALVIPGFRINCLNWILGHILNGRGEALSYLDRPGVWRGDEGDPYRTGSDPIRPETALPLDDLLSRLENAQTALEAALESAPGEFLGEVVPTRFGDRPRWQHLSGLAWHETYHTGQMELLREMVIELRREHAPGD